MHTIILLGKKTRLTYIDNLKKISYKVRLLASNYFPTI